MSIRRASALSMIAAVALTGGLLTGCAATGTAAPDAVPAHEHTETTANVAAQTQLYSAMRSLWGQHMEWTWATVVAFAGDSPALQATLERLLQNQVDIGDAVAGFYGEEAGDALTALLTTHIEEAVPVLTAAKAGDEAALGTAVEAWYANAAEIGEFLGSANPAWADTMEGMMEMHIDTTIGYASAVIGGDFASAIAQYDAAEAHMLDMADMLSAGLIAQFPDKF